MDVSFANNILLSIIPLLPVMAKADVLFRIVPLHNDANKSASGLVCPCKS
jgi:hypothetical protein